MLTTNDVAATAYYCEERGADDGLSFVTTESDSQIPFPTTTEMVDDSNHSSSSTNNMMMKNTGILILSGTYDSNGQTESIIRHCDEVDEGNNTLISSLSLPGTISVPTDIDIGTIESINNINNNNMSQLQVKQSHFRQPESVAVVAKSQEQEQSSQVKDNATPPAGNQSTSSSVIELSSSKHRPEDNNNDLLVTSNSSDGDNGNSNNRQKVWSIMIVGMMLVLVPSCSCYYLWKQNNHWRMVANDLKQEIDILQHEIDVIIPSLAADIINVDDNDDDDSSQEATLLDNCWIQAQAKWKLGNCASETKDTINQLSNSFWNTINGVAGGSSCFNSNNNNNNDSKSDSYQSSSSSSSSNTPSSTTMIENVNNNGKNNNENETNNNNDDDYYISEELSTAVLSMLGLNDLDNNNNAIMNNNKSSNNDNDTTDDDFATTILSMLGFIDNNNVEKDLAYLN